MSAAQSNPSGAGAAAKPRVFGRYELRQLLGRSRASMTWVAFDTRMDQETMLTMPRARPADAGALERWYRDARMAARLNHPNLAHVIEVGEHDHWPYVTVDRVLGVTLAEHLAARSDLPSPADVVVWIEQALNGLAFAHEAGLSHGDIQLHHLVVSDSGTVRLMGVGSNLALANASPPEGGPLLAQRVASQRDVLACGLLLHRLLAGQNALEEADVGVAVERMLPTGAEIVRLPWSTPHPIDEPLRAIANRATASQERQRYLNARTLLRALEGWRSSQGQDGGPLAMLLDRLHTVGHLPALEGVGRRVAGLAAGDAQRTDEIAEQILQDMALSFELLRQVNSISVLGTQAGSGPVLTVRRAVSLLGIDGIRRAANSLRTWPGPLNESNAAAMQRAMDRVRLAGHTAQMLRPPGYDPEVIYLVAVLQNLGRLLVQYHFPEEAEQIWQLMKPSTPPAPAAVNGEPVAPPPAQPGMPETAACFAVLGVDHEAIGAAVAKHWGLGDEMQQMMRRLSRERHPSTPQSDTESLLFAASCANDAVDALNLSPPAKVGAAVAAVAQRYARALSIGPTELQDALKAARVALRSGRMVAESMDQGDNDAPGEPAAAVNR